MLYHPPKIGYGQSSRWLVYQYVLAGPCWKFPSLPFPDCDLVTSKCTNKIPSCLLLVYSTLTLNKGPYPGVLTLSLGPHLLFWAHFLGTSPILSLCGVSRLPLLRPVNIMDSLISCSFMNIISMAVLEWSFKTLEANITHPFKVKWKYDNLWSLNAELIDLMGKIADT